MMIPFLQQNKMHKRYTVAYTLLPAVLVVLITALLMPNGSLLAQNVIKIYDTPGQHTFTVPSGVTSITVEAWGGGGGGESVAATPGSPGAAVRGGGGGGAYSSVENLSVTPDQSYTVTVGQGGPAGQAGGNSYFDDGNDIKAGGGLPGSGISAGNGGVVITGDGEDGENGDDASSSNSGAGGASANGGLGGASVSHNNDGKPGNSPGGGGSGASRSAGAASYSGGSGAPGRVIISYEDPAYNNAALEITFNGVTDEVGETVGFIDAPPDNVEGIPDGLNVSQYRWVITGGSFTSATIRFLINNIPDAGIGNPDDVLVYSRPTPGSGSFALVGLAAHTVGALQVTVTSFSEFVFASDDPQNSLPVELTFFNASVERFRVNLNWETASEIENYGFAIQRSEVGGQTSEVGWKEIGFVEGHGTVNTPRSYSFTDEVQTSGQYSYRLKQIDLDGTYEYYGPVVVVIGEVAAEFFLFDAYPNPANPATQIEFVLAEPGRTTLHIYNILGQQVATLVDSDLTAGQIHRVQFDGRNLSSGVYFYVLQSGRQQEVKKLLIMK